MLRCHGGEQGWGGGKALVGASAQYPPHQHSRRCWCERKVVDTRVEHYVRAGGMGGGPPSQSHLLR